MGLVHRKYSIKFETNKGKEGVGREERKREK